MKQLSIQTNSKTYDVLVGNNLLNEQYIKEFSDRESLLIIDSGSSSTYTKRGQCDTQRHVL